MRIVEFNVMFLIIGMNFARFVNQDSEITDLYARNGPSSFTDGSNRVTHERKRLEMNLEVGHLFGSNITRRETVKWGKVTISRENNVSTFKPLYLHESLLLGVLCRKSF